MEFLTHLWLPIVASAAAVWIASCLAWMVVGHHKKDWKAIPSEADFIQTVKRMGIATAYAPGAKYKVFWTLVLAD
mgnify:CR=1 FL=1